MEGKLGGRRGLEGKWGGGAGRRVSGEGVCGRESVGEIALESVRERECVGERV